VLGGGLSVHPVVEHEERDPEDPEGVLGPQFVISHVDVELLREAASMAPRPMAPTVAPTKAAFTPR
jgi:hypothetical protein